MIYQWGYDVAIIDIPMVGQSYHLKDWSIDCQRTLNLYPQVVESGNTPQVSALLPTEGLFRRYEFDGPIRGLYALSDRIFVVANQLFIIKDDEIAEIGEISGSGLVTFADNGLQVMIVGDDTYSYSLEDGAFSQLVVDDGSSVEPEPVPLPECIASLPDFPTDEGIYALVSGGGGTATWQLEVDVLEKAKIDVVVYVVGDSDLTDGVYYYEELDNLTSVDVTGKCFPSGDRKGVYTYDARRDKFSIFYLEDEPKPPEVLAFFGASSLTFLDSRFIWTIPNSGRIQWSKLLSTDSTALSYATAESKSDNLVRVIASNGQLWLIGEKTTEIWNSTGSQDLPFQRQSGSYIPVGCAAKNSIAVFGSSLIWLAQTEHGDNQIMMSQGYQMQRISNHAIETEFSSYERTDDAYAFSYQQQGHSFYFISFPTAQKTWVFDGVTNMWHERSFYNTDTSRHEQHRASCHCFFDGEHLVGDRANGNIYRLDPNEQTDDGHTIVRERATPCVSPHGSRMIFDEVQLVCQVGQDTSAKPQIMFDWSDDRGKTWSNDRLHEISNDIGAVGEYEKRVIFRRLGQSFGRVFRVRMTDAGRLVVLGAKARVR